MFVCSVFCADILVVEIVTTGMSVVVIIIEETCHLNISI